MKKIGLFLVIGMILNSFLLAELKPEKSNVKSSEIKTQNDSYLGVWKLSTKSEDFPCPCEIGSSLTIKKDGTFLVTSKKYSTQGVYIVKNNIFTFNFSDNSTYSFNFIVDKKSFSLECIKDKSVKSAYIK